MSAPISYTAYQIIPVTGTRINRCTVTYAILNTVNTVQVTANTNKIAQIISKTVFIIAVMIIPFRMCVLKTHVVFHAQDYSAVCQVCQALF